MAKRKQPKFVPRNDTQYDCLASTYVIPDVDGQLDRCAHSVNNLYNQAMYLERQLFFKKHHFSNYYDLDKEFRRKAEFSESLIYQEFPYQQIAQQTIRDTINTWVAYGKAIKSYHANPSKFTGRPRIPGYLDKGARHTFHITNQNCKIKNGYLIIAPRNGLLNIKLKVAPEVADVNAKLKRVTFVPLSKGLFKVVIQYKIPQTDIEYMPDNQRYMGIDPGVDNAFVCAINDCVNPLIINGRNIVAINQEYNDKIAKLSALHAILGQNYYTKNTRKGTIKCYTYSQQQYQITNWRNRHVNEFAHQATKRILDYALNNDVHTIIIGKNRDWKKSVDMNKKNNQNFVGLPHQKMIDLLTYKANLHGIAVVTTNESYTSQTSFLDHEEPVWRNGNKSRKKRGISPIVRRKTRSRFYANDGNVIHADVNAALQIIKKKVPRASFAPGITGFVLNPHKECILI